MIYSIPYGKTKLEFDTHDARVLFTGEMTNLPAITDIQEELLRSLDTPIGSEPLASLAQGKKKILFLVEDNTRETPLDVILPIIVDYLNDAGIPDEAISFLTAPGTHRIMTDEEIRAKLGEEIVRRFKIVQGVGNIVPHSDAGFSGGAKIVQPGICDFVTTQATHRAAGFCPDIPLGMAEGNPCRAGIDAVGKAANLAFIINIVKNYNGDIAGIFCGDYLKAHRAGVEMAKKSFCIEMDEQADIVVASSYPADIDYWQGIKGLTSAYFAVKQGGAIILAAPCSEGMVHNHPLYAHWLASPLEDVLNAIKSSSPYDMDTDVIAAVVALGSRRTLKRAKVYMVSDGLTDEEIKNIGYIPAGSVQEALDAALAEKPDATVGILPQGGISLPILKHGA